jgi:hypothetical protein
MRIVNIIHESDGRFLQFDENEGYWVEVKYSKAREKISHIFRNQKDRERKNDYYSKSEGSREKERSQPFQPLWTP